MNELKPQAAAGCLLSFIVTKNHLRFATDRHIACKLLINAYGFRVHVYYTVSQQTVFYRVYIEWYASTVELTPVYT